MSIDFNFSDDIVEAVIAVLKNELPDDWLVNTNESPLTAIQPGDLSDYPVAKIREIAPIVIVKSTGNAMYGKQGINGVHQTVENIRVVMVRKHEDCFDENGPMKNMVKARYQYASELGKAIFSDPQRKLAVINGPVRTEVSLTNAQVINMIFSAWDYEGTTLEVATVKGIQSDIWAIACDFQVLIRSG